MIYIRQNTGNSKIGEILQKNLHRVFTDTNRTTIVSRSILEDEKYPGSGLKYETVGWFVHASI